MTNRVCDEYIHSNIVWDVITRGRLNLNGGLTKPPFTFWHEFVIMSHRKQRIWIYHCYHYPNQLLLANDFKKLYHWLMDDHQGMKCKETFYILPVLNCRCCLLLYNFSVILVNSIISLLSMSFIHIIKTWRSYYLMHFANALMCTNFSNINSMPKLPFDD